MPSDQERLDHVRETLKGAWAEYRRAAALAADEVDALLRDASPAAGDNGLPPLARELGAFGTGAIDVGRLSAFLERTESLPKPPVEALRAAAAVLREIAAGKEQVEVPDGTPLSEAVGHALARLGRAFGAAHVVAQARAGRYDAAAHEPWLRAFPFQRWTRRQRRLAPPLILSVSGADLRAGGLSDYLDGTVKLVLLVRGEAAPPAPLVRLITPGTFVAQTRDGAELARLAAWDGPAVLAWVPASAAAFVHDPATRDGVRILAEAPAPRRAIGGMSTAQLSEEIQQLKSMAGQAQRVAAGPGEEAATAAAPADRLAAWLLQQADAAGATGERAT